MQASKRARHIPQLSVAVALPVQALNLKHKVKQQRNNAGCQQQGRKGIQPYLHDPQGLTPLVQRPDHMTTQAVVVLTVQPSMQFQQQQQGRQYR
jgi:hypothetical protein